MDVDLSYGLMLRSAGVGVYKSSNPSEHIRYIYIALDYGLSDIVRLSDGIEPFRQHGVVKGMEKNDRIWGRARPGCRWWRIVERLQLRSPL